MYFLGFSFMASTVFIYFTSPRLDDTYNNNLMLFMLLVISFFFLSIFFTATLFLTFKKIKRLQELENYAKALKGSLSAKSGAAVGHQRGENDTTHLAESLLLEIFPSKSAKWRSLLSEKRCEGGEDSNKKGSGKDEEVGRGGGGRPVKVQDKVVTGKGGVVQDKCSSRTGRGGENDPTHLAESLLLEILPSKPGKWRSLLSGKGCEGGQDPRVDGSGQDKDQSKGGSVQDKVTDEGGPGREKVMDKTGAVPEEKEDKGEPVQERDVDKGEVWGEEKRVVKKKKKKGKKKNNRGEIKGGDENEMMVAGVENGSGLEIPDLVCLCPLTAMGSATQRKIKLLYHEVVKSCESNTLTLAQVIEFTSCLAEAKEELVSKAEAIKRKFTIKKALLSKADRSSIERLHQQIYELEKQQKRLEEDACVYNWLQQQLDLSPACKKLLETSAKMELKTKSSKRQESKDANEFADISFEELLAQEKKDSFWQKNWKSRMCSR